MAFSLPAPSTYAHTAGMGLPFPVAGWPSTPVRGAPAPATGVGVRDNSTTPGFPTNGPILHVLPVTLDVSGGYMGGRDELMFIETPQRRPREALERHHLRSLSALNAHLRSDAGRRAYGALSTPTEENGFLREWRLYGMQKIDVPTYDATDLSGATTTALPFVVQKQAIMFNYWMTAGHRIKPGSEFWLIPRRYKDEDTMVLQERVFKRARSTLPPPPPADATALDGERFKAGALATATGAALKLPGAITPGTHKLSALCALFQGAIELGKKAAPLNDQEVAKSHDQHAGLHFWQLVPYVSTDRSPPPPELCEGPGWRSSPLFVGIAAEQYFSEAITLDRMKLSAQAAVFPTKCDRSYQDELRKRVPRIVVYIRCGRART